MAQKLIYEYDAKMLIARELPKFCPEWEYHEKSVVLTSVQDLDLLLEDFPWLQTEKLVAKPDQLFGKRGKSKTVKPCA